MVTQESINLCNLDGLKQLRNKDLTVLIIQESTLWVGSKYGLFSLDLDTYRLKSYYHDSEVLGSISDNYIQDFVLDKNSLLWIATTEGVNLYDKDKEKFKHYKQQPFSDNGLSVNDIISLYIDKENLVWLGTYVGGVNILDPNQHQFEHLLTKSDVINLGNNTAIHGIVKDQYEALWLASYGGGLIHYDLMTGKISRPLTDQNIEYDKFAWNLMIDHHDRLWQASLDELNIIDVKSKKKYMTQFIVDGDVKQNMEGVNRIFEDNLGGIWIVSEYGFFRCDSVTMVDNQLMVSITDLTSSLPKSYTSYIKAIGSIVQDQNGNFLVGG
ncbi:MAG: two-component regulator propeller domain-containing protein [Enterobacterales bacterium]|nr:two-component regulator propeller domain-containing protein [Enterobacterales bacterium]